MFPLLAWNLLEPLITFIEPIQSEEKRFALMVIVIGCSTGILITTICVTLGTINAFHRRNSEQQFKREMLSMGMSAEEIERVIESTAPTEDDMGHVAASAKNQQS